MVNDAADVVNGRLILRGITWGMWAGWRRSRVPDAPQRATLLRRAGTQAARVMLSAKWAPALQRTV